MSTPIFNALAAFPWNGETLPGEQVGLGTVYPTPMGLGRMHQMYWEPRRWKFRWKFVLRWRGEEIPIESTSSGEATNLDRVADAWRLVGGVNSSGTVATGGGLDDWTYGVSMQVEHYAANARNGDDGTEGSSVWPAFALSTLVTVGDDFSFGERWEGFFTTRDAQAQGGMYGHVEFSDGFDIALALGGKMQHVDGPTGSEPTIQGDLWLSWLRWEFDSSTIP